MNTFFRFNVIPLLSQLIILVIVMFDSGNGMAIGKYFVSIPNSVELVLHVLGNLLWLLGIVLFIGSLVSMIIIYVLTENKQKLHEAIKEKTNNPTTLARLYRVPIFSFTGLLIALLATASGFWFFGPALITTAVTSLSLRKFYINEMKKLKFE